MNEADRCYVYVQRHPFPNGSDSLHNVVVPNLLRQLLFGEHFPSITASRFTEPNSYIHGLEECLLQEGLATQEHLCFPDQVASATPLK